MRPSITSARSKSSERSLENIIEDLGQRLPRYEDIVYVMSIESDKSQPKNRGSDIIEKLDVQNRRYGSSRNNSTEMAVEGERGGSFGTSGNLVPMRGTARLNSLTQNRQYHSCDCYRGCIGRGCNCFQFMEPCVENRCCAECVDMKRKLLMEREERQKQQAVYFSQAPSTPVMSFLNQPTVPPEYLFQQVSTNSGYFGLGNQQQQHQGPVVHHQAAQHPHQRYSHTSHTAQPSISDRHRPLYEPISEQKTIYSESIDESQQSRYAEQQSSCACKKTKCLKMYCECFARRGFCSPRCSCQDCLNRVENQTRRMAVIESIKQQDKGCHCKKTKCQKKYCKCFAGGEKCTKYCTCENCNNMNEELRQLRKRQSDLKMEPQQQQPIVQPVKQLPTEIVFEMPDFSRLSLGGPPDPK